MEIDTYGTIEALHPKTMIGVLMTLLNGNLISAWEWPWTNAYFRYTGNAGKDLKGMNLATVVIHNDET